MTYDKWKTTNPSDEFLGNPFQCPGEEPKPEGRAVPITQAPEDHLRLALQLIASLPVPAEIAGRNATSLAKAIAVAREALSETEHDPMCEVLR